MQGRAEGIQCIAAKASIGQEPGDSRRWRDAGAESAEGRRGHAEGVEEDVQHEETRPERRHRHTAHAEEPAQVIEPAVAPHRRHHAKRDAGREGDDERGQRQLERRGHALEQVLEHGPPGRVALAEVSTEDATEIAPILDEHRLVETHPTLHLGDVLRCGERPRFHQRRVTWEDVRQHERDDRDAEQRRYDEEDSLGDVAEHA